MKRLNLMYWIITIGTLLSGLLLILALSPPAKASGCEHGCNRNTTVVYNNDDNDGWKHALGAVISIPVIRCRIKAGKAGFKEGRWWTWCGEKEKPQPLPNPGPAPNDVTPTPTGVRLYQ